MECAPPPSLSFDLYLSRSLSLFLSPSLSLSLQLSLSLSLSLLRLGEGRVWSVCTTHTSSHLPAFERKGNNIKVLMTFT